MVFVCELDRFPDVILVAYMLVEGTSVAEILHPFTDVDLPLVSLSTLLPSLLSEGTKAL